jgi:pimeloyl-ACP methyl ester carboxylesterase
MRQLIFTTLFSLLALCLSAQSIDTLKLNIDGASIHAVLTTPQNGTSAPLAVFIAGSGPTDLDGNPPGMKNNSLRYLSDELVKQQIATLRFDKRGIAHSADPNFSEAQMSIERYVADVVAMVNQMKAKGFSDIYIIGHSEGSLIGLITLQTVKAKGFISLAGAGFPADEILKTQLKPQLPPDMFSQVTVLLDSLKNGHQVSTYPQALFSLFRPSVQPYLISWFKYSPTALMEKLTCPALIVQGDKDLQVTVTDAQQLSNASKNGTLVVVKNMNHVLKTIVGEVSENYAAYTNPNLPINAELATAVIDFIKKQ